MSFQKQLFEEALEEIDSFEAYYKNVIFRNNCLVVPYINLGVSNHELSPGGKEMSFMNFAYLVFRDVSYLKVYLDKAYLVVDQQRKSCHLHFGGNYMDLKTA